MSMREMCVEAAAQSILASANDNSSDGPMEWDEAVELATAALDAILAVLSQYTEEMSQAGLEAASGPANEEGRVVFQADCERSYLGFIKAIR